MTWTDRLAAVSYLLLWLGMGWAFDRWLRPPDWPS